MSTTTSTSATNVSSSLPTIGTGGGGGRSASYFFGFLVTFAILLVLFVVAGLVSRQRMLARRRAAIAAGVDIGPGDPWVFRRHDMVANPCDEVRRLKPVWSETWVEKPDLGREERKNSTVDGSPLMKWEDIMPLGATLTLPERESEPTAEVPASEQEKARRRSSTVSSWISSFSASKNTATVRDEPSPPRVPIEEGLRDPEAEVDVVVMIAMPRSPDTRGYEFGVTSLPVTVNEPEEAAPVHVS